MFAAGKTGVPPILPVGLTAIRPAAMQIYVSASQSSAIDNVSCSQAVIADTGKTAAFGLTEIIGSRRGGAALAPHWLISFFSKPRIAANNDDTANEAGILHLLETPPLAIKAEDLAVLHRTKTRPGDASLKLMEIIGENPAIFTLDDVKIMGDRARSDGFFGSLLCMLVKVRPDLKGTIFFLLSRAAKSSAGTARALKYLAIEDERFIGLVQKALWHAAWSSPGAAQSIAELALLKPAALLPAIAKLGKMAKYKTHAADVLGWLAEKKPARNRVIFYAIKKALHHNISAAHALGKVIANDPDPGSEAVRILVHISIDNLKDHSHGAKPLRKTAAETGETNALLAEALRDAAVTANLANIMFPVAAALAMANIEIAGTLSRPDFASQRHVFLAARALSWLAKKYPALAADHGIMRVIGEATRIDGRIASLLADIAKTMSLLRVEALEVLKEAAQAVPEAKWELKFHKREQADQKRRELKRKEKERPKKPARTSSLRATYLNIRDNYRYMKKRSRTKS